MNKTLSNRSMAPPWPGMMLPKSLMPYWRLITEAERSPSTPSRVAKGVTSATAGMPFLGWLSYGGRVGISTQEPMLLDLAVLQVAFGFQLQINVAQIICIIAAICMYKGLANKL